MIQTDSVRTSYVSFNSLLSSRIQRRLVKVVSLCTAVTRRWYLLHCVHVWQSSRSKQQTMFVPAKLTVVGVFNQLRDIASMSGNAVSVAVVVFICAMIVVTGYS